MYRVTLHMTNGVQISTYVNDIDAAMVRREMGNAWSRGVTKGEITIQGDPTIVVNPVHVIAVTTQADNR
jgi:hypothetical protein